LIGEEGICSKGIKALFVGKIAERKRSGERGINRLSIQHSLKDRRAVQVCRSIQRASADACARKQTASGSLSAGRKQLHGTAAVGGSGVKGDGEQRVIVEEAIAGADDGFAVTSGIPSDAEAGGDVAIVAGKAFDDAEGLLRLGVDRRGRSKKRGNFDVVADAVVDGEFPSNAPRVLAEEGEGYVVKGHVGVSDTLDINRGIAEAVGLRVGDSGQTGSEREAAKGDVATEVELEDLLLFGAELDEVGVGADLESVAATGDGAVIAELEAALDAVHGRVGFPAEVGDTGDVNAKAGAPGEIRITEVHAAAGELEAEFVEGGVAQDGVVLEGDVEVGALVEANARTGVLAEDLVLRSGLHAVGQCGRNADAKEGRVPGVPALVKTSRPQASFFVDREIAAQFIQRNVAGNRGAGPDRKGHKADADGRTRRHRIRRANDAVDLSSERAIHGSGKKMGSGQGSGGRGAIKQGGHGDCGAVDILVQVSGNSDVSCGPGGHGGSEHGPEGRLKCRVEAIQRVVTSDRVDDSVVSGKLVGSHAERDGRERCRVGDAGHITGGEAEITLADAGEAGLFALRVFIGEKVKGLVLPDGAAKRRSGLHASVSLLGGDEIACGGIDLTGEWVACLEGFVAKIAENVAVKIIAAAFSDDIDDTTGRAAVLSVIVAENQLKFLHALLGNGGADAVDGIVHSVRAINADHVGARAGPADAQTAIRSGADGVGVVTQGLRVGLREIDVVAAIDRQVVNVAFIHGLRTFRARDFDRSGFRGDRDGLRLRANFQLHVEAGLLANSQLERGIFVWREAAALRAELVDTRNQANEVVTPGLIHIGGALGTRGQQRHADFRAADSQTLWVSDISGKSCGVDLRRRGA